MSKRKKTTRKRPPAKQFKAWSFSRLSDYRRCPRQAKLKHLDKLPTTKGPALAHGSEVHDDLRAVATGAARLGRERTKALAWIIERIEKGLKAAEDYDVEQSWAFTENWTPCSPTAWDICVVRMKIDLLLYDVEPGVLMIIDFKTGKIREREHMEQLKLYALGAFKQLADIKHVYVAMAYVDHEKVLDETYSRKQEGDLEAYWQNSTRRMLRATTFEPTTGIHCRWCDFSKKKGGPCEY